MIKNQEFKREPMEERKSIIYKRKICSEKTSC